MKEKQIAKYRIKIIHYFSGREEYFAQVKAKFVWLCLEPNGTSTIVDHCSYNRSDALSRIELHFKGNSKVQRIDFQYIVK